MNGRGGVEPNPMVGCVIARAGRVIGEGNHARYGGPHAEPTALANCSESPERATAYVTLEPCCHLNKQTPPCAPRLIAAKISRVVLGCVDPNPAVNGNGVRMLRDAGIVVDGPFLEADCKQLIAPFLARVNFHRPYVTLKWAETADGKIAGANGARLQISNALSTRAVHQLRSRCDAVAVGIGTVLSDDPELTVRGITGGRRPQRIVFDSSLRIPPGSKLVQTATTFPTAVFYAGHASTPWQLEQHAVSVERFGADPKGRLILREAIESLTSVTHLLVEPGPTLAAGLFDANLADRLWVYRSPSAINDPTAPTAPVIPSQFKKTGEVRFGTDVLTEYVNSASDVFFAAAGSADLVLAKSDQSADSQE